MKVGTTNVRELYFEHQDLTRINSKLTFAVLHNMVLQLKVNTVSVLCTLGGGMYSYICIIPITHATLAPLTPFIVPVHPGPSMPQTTLRSTRLRTQRHFTKLLLTPSVRTNVNIHIITRTYAHTILHESRAQYARTSYK